MTNKSSENFKFPMTCIGVGRFEILGLGEGARVCVNRIEEVGHCGLILL